MIINFTIDNYRSFKDKKVLGMEVTAIKELNGSAIEKEEYRLFPSAAIYGANSGRKNNSLKAIGRFEKIINSSPKLSSADELKISPFLLNQEAAKEPSFLEIELSLGNIAYRYGFTANNQEVCEEWLHTKEERAKEEKRLFVRTEKGTGIASDYDEDKGLEEKIRDNGLFLPTIDSFNGEIAEKIIYKIDNLQMISGISHEFQSGLINGMCNIGSPDLSLQQEIQDFLKFMNIGLNRFGLPEDEKLAKKIKVHTICDLYNKQGEVTGETRFFVKEYESSGTNKLFDLAALAISQPMLGGLLVVGELGLKPHSLLTQHIIRLFNNPKTNPKGIQLIPVTHGTNLLNVKIFRGDQIWLTEKDYSEATDLYSLAEFRGPEGSKIWRGHSFEEDYINGCYGTIPYIKG